MTVEQGRMWEQTISANIFSFLKQKAENEGMVVSIENKGDMVETIHFGDESVQILKRTNQSGDGDFSQIETCIESHQYKRLPWWQQAIDSQKNTKLVFLDPPVMWVAKDAQIEDWEAIFRPSVAVVEQGIYSGDDQTQLEQAKNLVRDTVFSVLTPVIHPDFAVQYQDGGLRCMAITPEAKESRTKDNDAYKSLCNNVKASVPEILHRYHE
ncbi:hypothetical protein BH09PAT2_BH09PAT2_07620 [soil metagenome]